LSILPRKIKKQLTRDERNDIINFVDKGVDNVCITCA